MFVSRLSEVGQIIDFSRRASAFRYIVYGRRLNGSCELVTYLGDKSFYL